MDGSKAGDWRLPNVKELQSLIDFAYYNPALSSASGKSRWVSGDAFIGVQPFYYRSSTAHSNNMTDAWVVNMLNGNVSYDDKINIYYVWPVRKEQKRRTKN